MSLSSFMLEEINLFTEKNLDECTFLFVEVFNKKPWNESWTFETAKSLLSQILNTPGFIGFILQKQGIILGFVVGYWEQRDKSKNFYLKEICVSSNKQRQGIGTKLIEHLVYRLNEIDVNLIYLLTMKDEYAEVFYSKKGFLASHRMIMMTKHL